MANQGMYLEKEEKMKSRKAGLLIVWMICFMLGWMLSCLGNDYEDILFMNYVRNFVPLRESYCPSEPRWIYKQYVFQSDQELIQLFHSYKNKFEGLLEYIKNRKEYDPYNVYYEYKLDEKGSTWKSRKLIYEYAYGYDGRYGPIKRIEDILFHPDTTFELCLKINTKLQGKKYGDYETYEIDQSWNSNKYWAERNWNPDDKRHVPFATVHLVEPEACIMGEEYIDEFAVFLLEQHFLADPETFVEIIVRNVVGEKEPFIIMDFGSIAGKSFSSWGYIFYHPNLQKDVEVNDEESARNSTKKLIDLGEGWYFFEIDNRSDEESIEY